MFTTSHPLGPRSTTTALLAVIASVGCSGTADPPAATVESIHPLPVEQVRVGGLQRRVRLYVPANVAARPALILVLHGSGGDGERFRRFTAGAFERLADRHGFIVAYPDALGGQWHDCRARAPYQSALAGVDDVMFMQAIVRYAADRLGRPLGNAFVVGYSNGGQLVFRLAWEAPGEFAALAAIGAHLPVSNERACTVSSSPVSLLLVSGTDDPINPWAGGLVRAPGAGPLGTVLSAETTAAYFRELAGLPVESTVEQHNSSDRLDDTSVEIRRWTSAGRPKVLWLIVHGGATRCRLPDARFPADVVGKTSTAVDGAEVIWSFLAEHLQTGG